MGTDKPDINRANIKENHHDQPVTISPDIEHKAVVTNVVNGIKTLTDIRKITPIGRFDYCIPRIQGFDSVRVEHPEFAQNGFADDDQAGWFLACNYRNKIPLFINLFR